MPNAKPTIRIDIVSDVVCPWCIVGYKQLEPAMDALREKADFELHWHPFELNHDMPDEGQDLAEHISEKYGSSKEDSAANRKRLSDLGDSLGFRFDYFDGMRMVNTYKAHQLLHWAREQGREHDLKLALFKAYFSDRKDVNNADVLADAAASVGLDRDEALAVLLDGRYADAVRQEEVQWIQRGIQAVPAVVLNEKYLVSGAQGTENYTQVLSEVLKESASA
ncbi:MAG: DsbA family oxidoreductase [Alphaproteobacteria bacterium]